MVSLIREAGIAVTHILHIQPHFWLVSFKARDHGHSHSSEPSVSAVSRPKPPEIAVTHFLVTEARTF